MSFKNRKEERNIILAKLVERHPVLYDYEHAAYSNRYVQDEAWRTIGDQFQDSVPNCKENWRSLRNCFARDLRHMTTNPNGYTKKRPYYMSEFMQFLVPYLPIAQRRNHAILTGRLSPGGGSGDYDDDDHRGEEVVKIDLTVVDEGRQRRASPEGDDGRGPPEDLSRAVAEDIVQRIKEEEIKTEPDLFWTSGDSNGGHFHKTLVDDDDHPLPPPPPPSSCAAKRLKPNLTTKKRRKSTEINGDCDPDVDFLRSILPDMKKLSDQKKLTFKIKNLELLNQLLYDETATTTDRNLERPS